jgi:hypothetical protein
MVRANDRMVRLVVRQVAETGGRGLPPEALCPPVFLLNVLGWAWNWMKADAAERAREDGLIGQTADDWWHVTRAGLAFLNRG